MRIQLQPRTYLLLAAMLLLVTVGFALIPANTVQDRWIKLPFLAFLSLLTGGTSLCAFRARINADESGLRWRRTFGDWQSARWDEVTDYFYDTKWSNYAVHFTDGRTLRFDSSWPHFRRLMTLIAAQATEAKTRGWLNRTSVGTVTGTHTFRYTQKSLQKAKGEVAQAAVFVALFTALCILVVVDPWHKLLAVTLIVLAPLLAACAWLFKHNWMLWKDLLGRKDEWLVGDENGLTLHRGDQTISTPWSGIVRASHGRGAQHLETATDDIVFNGWIDDRATLGAMLCQYAPQTIVSRTRPTSRELLAPTERVDGKRTFHSRTRTNRASLAMPLVTAAVFFAVALWAAEIDRRYPIGNPMPVVPLLVMGLVGCACWLGWLLWYHTFRIIVDKESIIRHTLFGTTRVFYEEIVELGYESAVLGNGYLATRDGRHPITWPRSLASERDLVDELTQRTGLTVTVPVFERHDTTR